MTVDIDLKPAGKPCGNPDITEAVIVIDEVDIVVEALAGVVFKERFMGTLVVPWLEGCAGLHGRENTDDARVVAPFFNNVGDDGLLALGALSNELNGDVMSVGKLTDVLTDTRGVLLSKLRKVEDADLSCIQKRCHALWMPDGIERALENKAVEAG
jgi:hypothetical protein